MPFVSNMELLTGHASDNSLDQDGTGKTMVKFRVTTRNYGPATTDHRHTVSDKQNCVAVLGQHPVMCHEAHRF